MMYAVEMADVFGGAEAVEDLGQKIDAVFKKHFPHSLVKSEFTKSLGESLSVYFSLVSELSQLPSCIRDNDPAYTIWIIRGFGQGGNSEGQNLSAELIRGGRYKINPVAGSYYAMGSVKLGWRNKSGMSSEKLVAYFDAYAAKSKDIMKANVDNSYGTPPQVAIYKKQLA